MNGYTIEIDTPEKRAAQFKLDLPHYLEVCRNDEECACGACKRVVAFEHESLDAEILIAELLTNGHDAHYARLQKLREQKFQADEAADIADWLDEQNTRESVRPY